MYNYYTIKGDIDGTTEALFGSFLKADCTFEFKCERVQWKSEGYTNLRLVSQPTAEKPDPSIYTSKEINSMKGSR